MSGRAESADAYYTLLARLPWMEAGAALTVLAVALALFGGRTRLDRRIVAGAIALAAVLAMVFGGLSPIVIGAAVIAVGLSLFPGLAARSTWGGWTGLIALILVLAIPAQALAPEAAFLFVWTGLLAAMAAAMAAVLDPGLTHPRSLAPAAIAAVLGGGWILAQAHGVFLGVGMDLPGVLVLLGLLVLMLVRPLSPEQGLTRPLLIAAASALLIGGVELSDYPDAALAVAAVERTGFVVSLENHHSAVTERADVVLPVAVVTEKAFSHTLTETCILDGGDLAKKKALVLIKVNKPTIGSGNN
jgi:hypothetical protein